jgi:hypothetical protein
MWYLKGLSDETKTVIAKKHTETFIDLKYIRVTQRQPSIMSLTGPRSLVQL